MNPETQQTPQSLSNSPAPQPVFQQPAYQQPYAAPSRGTNTLAIIGLVCSFFFQIPGLVMSIIALNQIKKTGEGGKGLAIAGIIISAIGLVLGFIWFIFWIILVVASSAEAAPLSIV